MNQLFTFFHGIVKKSRVNTIITNNRLRRLPNSQVPARPGYDTPELRSIFLQGWRACERGEEIYNNPYGHLENLLYSLHNAWEVGYLDCYNTRRTNPYVAQTREFITDMFRDAQTHGFCAGVQNTRLELHYEGDMDELSVRSMLDELIYRYRTCIYFSDFTLNNMEDFLNEHLDGTSTIRLA
jgi:hypothetical protein